MNKNFLKELILPAFWLLFFIISSKNDKTINLKKESGIEVKKQIGAAAETGDVTDKNKEAKFTKAVYLSGF